MKPYLQRAERDLLEGSHGEGAAIAMRILVDAARLLGADALIEIQSAHIDGCLYHGDSGALFAELLFNAGARVSVPTTLNVGSMDLLHAGRERLEPSVRDMARRMMNAYVAMGCRQTWTCSPYQAGHRPALGKHVAWGESNAVAFCNSVLGARTNRYGDFLDICAAITGRAPRTGLHLTENRRATVHVDATGLPQAFWREDVAFPILGAWLGATVGSVVAVIEGVGDPGEDRLKALGAAAASSGSVGLFHIAGVTPEASDVRSACHNLPIDETISLTSEMLRLARAGLSTARVETGAPVDAVAIGSPHLSADELRALDRMLGDRRCGVPLYACTGRHALSAVRAEGLEQSLGARGVVLVADTCIVVTPILPKTSGILVTNSGKFAHYAPANTGYDVVFAGLADCVRSAVEGRLSLDGEVRS